MTSGWDSTLRFWSVATGQEMVLLDDATPLPARMMSEIWEEERTPFYRRQADINPVADVLVWQEVEGRTRVLSLPTLTEVDQSIFQEQPR